MYFLSELYIFMELYFSKWLENQVLGGGLPPPKECPVDPTPAPGQTDAFPRFYAKGSPELPPIKKKLKKK
jgi:hypothetical protein